MRNQLVIALAISCAAAAVAGADPAKAKAANTRGYGLHKKKKYKEAAIEYRKAIAEDPSHLLAHYNLACVASLTKDRETAIAELAWVWDRASWDPAAKSAMAKAPKDRDLKWIIAESMDASTFVSNESEAENLLAPVSGYVRGKPAADPSIAKTLAAASGNHAEKCSAAALSAEMNSAKSGKGAFAGTLRDGVALLDLGGKLVARSEPIGCETAQDQLVLLNKGSGVPTPHESLESPLLVMDLFVAAFTSGARQRLTIFARKDKQLIPVFEAVTKSDAGTATVIQTPLGHIVYTVPGETKLRLFRWSQAAFKFVE